MKLLRYGSKGAEKPGMLDSSGKIRDLSGKLGDITPAGLAPAELERLRAIDPTSLPVVEGDPRIGVPVAGIRNVICIGLNYAKHAAEAGAKLPSAPMVFNKVSSALNGPNDDVVIPKGSEKTDWEVELAVVIGRRTSYVSKEEALDYVAGYTICNDVPEREFQMNRGGQFVKGKSCETFAPLGPWLVTADEIPDPQKLRVWLDVNGERMQDSTTADMIFGVAELVSDLSQYFVMEPGDVISTGTPEGVGLGHKPPIYLKPGDEMVVGVEGLGEQRQKVVAYAGR